MKRLPVFWGPGHKFQIVDGPGGSLNLLVAREPTDGHALVIVPSQEKQRRKRFEKALTACNDRYGKALRRLAE